MTKQTKEITLTIPADALQVQVGKLREALGPKLDNFTPAQALHFLTNGLKHYLNDSLSAIKQSDYSTVEEFRAKCHEEIDKRLEKLNACEVPSLGGSGARLDISERIWRELLVPHYMRAHAGVKKADATKAVSSLVSKGAEAAFLEILHTTLANIMPEVDDATLQAAYDKNWPKLEAEHARLVELEKMKESKLDLSLTF